MGPFFLKKGREMPGCGRASIADMKRVELAILQCVSKDAAANDGICTLSRHEIAERVYVSEFRVRTALVRLRNAEELVVKPRFGEKGAQLANGIAITEKGVARLKEQQ